MTRPRKYHIVKPETKFWPRRKPALHQWWLALAGKADVQPVTLAKTQTRTPSVVVGACWESRCVNRNPGQGANPHSISGGRRLLGKQMC